MTPSAFRIIAIDPGVRVTGYGVLEKTGKKIVVLASGTIRNSPSVSHAKRLASIHSGVVDLMEEYLPRELVLEDVFYRKNIRSTLTLGEVRGICSLAAAQRDIPVTSYATRKVKKAVVGNGGADKSQVQKMVQVLLNLDDPPTPLDVSDALALGITFFHDILIFPAGK
ncbi:MAG: crossover junction endodeoxyribonuclease RuvC [Candidatus Auribacterota bacterium]|nr:crossover junction endodeoxyribonuclease RuvC [Candidatus Auribacterota bacterium]